MSFYGFARFILTPLFKIFLRIKVEGYENFPAEGGFVVCGNHVSFLDPFMVAYKVKRRMSFMAKEEIFKTILKWPVTWLGGFSVNRGGADVSAIRQAIDIVRDGSCLLIFPEGTRSKDGKIGDFKTGGALIAIKTKADIIPVSIKIKNNKLRFFAKIHIKFGEILENPLKTSGKERLSGAESRAFMEKIRESVVALNESL